MFDHSTGGPLPRTVPTVCEHCSVESAVPWTDRGRIAECPHCRGWMDVPDPTAEFTPAETPPCEFAVRDDLGLRFEFSDGFPRPVWSGVVERFPFDSDPDLLAEVWTAAAECWLQQLQRVLPNAYRVDRSTNFLVLSALEPDDASRVLRAAERDRVAILQLLEGVVDDAGYGPHVVLLFHGHEAYYHFVAPHYPEGESGGSGGMFIADGLGCIAMPFVRNGWHATFVHELTHGLLAYLPLPLWLNEGITLMTEGQVGESEHFAPSAESLRDQKKFWREHSLQDLWTGRAFSRPDDGQKFAYELAEVFVRNLYSESREGLQGLLHDADWSDAGEAALEQHFGRSLHELAEEVLGPGKWTPQHPLFNDADMARPPMPADDFRRQSQ